MTNGQRPCDFINAQLDVDFIESKHDKDVGNYSALSWSAAAVIDLMEH